MLRDNATAAVEMRPPGEIPWEYCRESKAVEFLKSRPTQYIYIFIYLYLYQKIVELCNIYKAWIEYLDIQFEFHLGRYTITFNKLPINHSVN